MKGVKTNSWAAVLTLGLSLLAPPADAQGRAFLAGGELSGRDYYTYLGTIIPFPGSRLGNGWVQRYWVDYYGYGYAGGPGTVDATAWGAEALLGYQVSDPKRNWAALYLGARYTDTRLSPDDPGSDVRGGQLGVKAQAEGETWLAERLRANGIASYTFSTSGYWTRARVLQTLPNNLHTGPEVVFAGNPEYNVWRLGMVVGGFRPLGGYLDLKGGYSSSSNGSSAYGGIEFYREY